MGLAILLISAAYIHAAATTVVRYTDLPTQILTKNGSVQTHMAYRDAAQSKTGYLERSFWPHMSLSLGGEYGEETKREKPPYAAFDVSVNLYRGGRDVLEETLRNQQVQQRHTDVYRIYLSELAAAQDAYWQIVAISETLRHYEDSRHRIRQATNAAKYRLSRGLTTPTDVLEFERQDDLISEKIQALKQDKKERSMALATRLGAPPDIRVPESRVPDPDETPLPPARRTAEHHPDLAALRTQIAILMGEKSQLSHQSMPSLDAYSRYGAYTLDRFDLAAGLRMQIPVFADMHTENDQAALDHQITAQKRWLAQQERQRQTAMNTTQERLTYLNQAIQRAQKRIVRTEIFLKATLADYDRGVKNASDVRNAIETYRQDKTDETEQRLAYQRSKVALEEISPPSTTVFLKGAAL